MLVDSPACPEESRQEAPLAASCVSRRTLSLDRTVGDTRTSITVRRVLDRQEP